MPNYILVWVNSRGFYRYLNASSVEAMELMLRDIRTYDQVNATVYTVNVELTEVAVNAT